MCLADHQTPGTAYAETINPLWCAVDVPVLSSWPAGASNLPVLARAPAGQGVCAPGAGRTGRQEDRAIHRHPISSPMWGETFERCCRDHGLPPSLTPGTMLFLTQLTKVMSIRHLVVCQRVKRSSSL